MKKITLEQLRKALIKTAWNVNTTKSAANPLLVCYPNDILLELFGEEETEKNWIPDSKFETR